MLWETVSLVMFVIIIEIITLPYRKMYGIKFHKDSPTLVGIVEGLSRFVFLFWLFWLLAKSNSLHGGLQIWQLVLIIPPFAWSFYNLIRYRKGGSYSSRSSSSGASSSSSSSGFADDVEAKIADIRRKIFGQ